MNMRRYYIFIYLLIGETRRQLVLAILLLILLFLFILIHVRKGIYQSTHSF